MRSSQWVVSRARAEVQGLWVEVGGSALGPCDGSQLPGPRPKTKGERLGWKRAVRSSLAGHWGGRGKSTVKCGPSRPTTGPEWLQVSSSKPSASPGAGQTLEVAAHLLDREAPKQTQKQKP